MVLLLRDRTVSRTCHKRRITNTDVTIQGMQMNLCRSLLDREQNAK